MCVSYVRPERCLKEGSGSGQFSIGAPWGNLEWDSFTGDFERQLEGCGNGASLSMGTV